LGDFSSLLDQEGSLHFFDETSQEPSSFFQIDPIPVALLGFEVLVRKCFLISGAVPST